MTISLIIPILNAARTIEACLDHIRRQELQPDEILLVDNGSTDRTIEKIEAFARRYPTMPIRLLHERTRGAAAARNRGIAASTGELIALTDSDVFASPGWLASLAAVYASRGDIDGVGGVARIKDPRTISSKIQALNLFLPDSLRNRTVIAKHEIIFGCTMPTMNASYRRRVFDAVGRFDERLSVAGEDLDFQIRAFERGHKLLVGYPAAQIEHEPRESFGQFMVQVFNYRVAVPGLIRKHFTGRIFVQLNTHRVVSVPFPIPTVLTRRSLSLAALLLGLALGVGLLDVSALTTSAALVAAAVLLFLRSVLATRRYARVAGVSISGSDAFVLACLGRAQGLVTLLGRSRGSLANRVLYL